MGKASRTKQEGSRRDKIAAQRAAARSAERRNRLLIAGGAVIAVVAVVVAFVLIKSNSSSSTPSASSSSLNSGAPTGSALSSVLSTVTSVPVATTDAAADGKGLVSGLPKSITGNPLTSNGKPEVMYVGAEYCPYCAAERWSMIVALSRFGTFSGVTAIRSGYKNGAGTAEPIQGVPTWTFHGSTYTSNYIVFSPHEVQTNIPDPKIGYTNLETLTSAQQATFTQYNSGQSFPFMDFGNKYVIVGASYDGTPLASMTWSQIAAALSDSSSQVGLAINGTANYMTAAICKLTNNQPGNVCTSTVQALEAKI